ncbi:MAG: phosphotransferase [Acidimicrobiales bacterium]
MPAGAEARTGDVPAVLQHGDLWSENIIADGQEMTVVDWADASPSGFPLQDLAYFLSDSLARLDGARSADDRDRHFISLFKGTARSSAVLASWLGCAAECLGLRPGTVGALVGLGWARLAEAHRQEREPVEVRDAYAGAEMDESERREAIWFTDPALGCEWLPFPGEQAWPPRRGSAARPEVSAGTASPLRLR